MGSSSFRQGGVSGQKGQTDGPVGKGRTGPGDPGSSGDLAVYTALRELSACALGLRVAFCRWEHTLPVMPRTEPPDLEENRGADPGKSQERHPMQK